MDILSFLALKSMELIFITCGIIGLFLSLLLMVFPEQMQYLSNRFNRYFDMDSKLKFLDVDVQTAQFVFRHPIISGFILILGSLFVLSFLFIEFDAQRFGLIFFNEDRIKPLSEIILQVIILLLKLAGFAGLVIGGILLFASERLKAIDSKMAKAVTTKPFFDKLNEFHLQIDAIFLRYPVTFGMIGLIASVTVTFLFSALFLNRG